MKISLKLAAIQRKKGESTQLADPQLRIPAVDDSQTFF